MSAVSGNSGAGGVRLPGIGWRGSATSSFGAGLGAIVAVAVVLRVLYTVLAAPWPPEINDDQVFFHLMPAVLADGKGFIHPLLVRVGETLPTASHPPLYPVVLTGLAELGGTGQLVQRLTGTLFGAGTVVAIGLIGRRLAGARCGLIAAGIAAVYPILITADGALMSESMYSLLVAATLLAAYRLIETPRIGRAIVCGTLLGLAALTRGEALLLCVLLLLPLVRRPGGVRLAGVAALVMVLVLTPWTIRNFSVFDRFVLISTDAGAVIGGANCQSTYYGSNIGGWNFLCATPFPGNEAEQTAKQQREGIDFAADHVTRLPVVAAARLMRQWSFYRPWQTNPGRAGWAQNAGVVTYYVLLPLALYGLLVLWRRKAPIWVIAAPLMLSCAQAVLAYGFLRFRQPAEISLVVLAGVAIDQLWRSRADRRGLQAWRRAPKAPAVG